MYGKGSFGNNLLVVTNNFYAAYLNHFAKNKQDKVNLFRKPTLLLYQ
jgi:hypothetical protein